MSVKILVGDCRDALRSIPDRSIHCVVSSPPYFNLRSYLPDDHPMKKHEVGLEESPTEFVANLVAVFHEVHRVLRDDGVVWLNMGDSYAANRSYQVPSTKGGNKHSDSQSNGGQGSSIPDGLKPKDLIGIPWRLAFALQADGWWLRGDHVWAKPNGMPESVEDRPVRGHEYVFLLSKSERYWFDHLAVRTAPKASTITRLAQDVANQKGSQRANGGGKSNGPMKAVGVARHAPEDVIPAKERRSDKQRGHSRRHAGFNDRWDAMERNDQMAAGANLRSVWWVPPAQYRGAHFAVMPDLVAEICIRSGCPEGGTVLDPFFGAGTTGVVADRLGRNCIGIELSEANAEQAADRIRGDAAMFADVVVEAAA